MANGNAYPAVGLDSRGKQVGSMDVIQFTDSADQPGSGGGSIPDSWLVANPDDGLTADGNLLWDLAAKHGTDIAIDSGDHTLINILTAGWYDIILQGDARGDTTGAGSAKLSIAGDIANLDWLASADSALLQWTIIPADFRGFGTATLPAVAVAAPTNVSIAAQIAASAGTITAGILTSITIRKIA